jgi:hypothetical protein
MSNPLIDRRQAAHEAAEIADPESRVTAAIQTATRVRITPEVIKEFKRHGNFEAGLRAAFTAAGFEVVDGDTPIRRKA